MKKLVYLLGLFLATQMPTEAQNNAFSVQTTVENGVIEGNYDTCLLYTSRCV